MAENRWFKVWGREVLASIDLNSLTDHEERVWWRLLAAASNEEPRWTIEVTPVLARFCVSTPAKLGAALATFERRGMVRLEANAVTFVNAEKYQETPAARRKREQRERDRARDSDQAQERDMSRDIGRDVSQDKRVTSHVTSHGPVPHIARARGAAIAIASEAEADPVGEAEAGVTRHAAASADEDLYLGVRIPPGLRDRVIEHCEALGTRNLDAETVQAVIQCHEDLPAEDIDWARKELRRSVPRRAAWPGNVREVIAQRDGVPQRTPATPADYIPADQDPLNVALQYRRPVTSGGAE